METELDGENALVEESLPSSRKTVVRFYEPRDREAIRTICADTGFLGSPIDPVFEDRELFADYLTAYYTDAEPESTLVCEIEGRVVGYLNGSRHLGRYKRYRLIKNPLLFLRGMVRYFSRPYTTSTRKYVKWVLTQAGKQSPFTPQGMPHFHINTIPEAKCIAQTRVLIDRFFTYLKTSGEKAVYAQVVTYDKRRGPRVFQRYGFKVVDQVEVTKYQWLRPQPIYLFTIVKDLTANTVLYGVDLWKNNEKNSRTDSLETK